MVRVKDVSRAKWTKVITWHPLSLQPLFVLLDLVLQRSTSAFPVTGAFQFPLFLKGNLQELKCKLNTKSYKQQTHSNLDNLEMRIECMEVP